MVSKLGLEFNSLMWKSINAASRDSVMPGCICFNVLLRASAAILAAVLIELIS